MIMDKKNSNLPDSTKIALFKGKQIRKTLYQNEWWFSVVDVVETLTDSVNPRDYWYKMKTRVEEEGEFQLSTIYRQLKLEASDGKKYETDCAELRSDAKAGGAIAGGARKKLEKRLGRSVVTKKNFLPRQRAGLKKSGVKA